MGKNINDGTTIKEVYEAIEILLESSPEGVTTRQVWLTFFKDRDVDKLRANVSNLIRTGYLLKSSGSRPYLLKLSDIKYVPIKERRAIADNYLRRNDSPSPCVMQAPAVRLPPVKIGDLNELRGVIGKAIDALETIQGQIQPLLAKLLDIEKDCSKLEKVQAILLGMKSSLQA